MARHPAPHVSGTRLGLILGSALAHGVFRDARGDAVETAFGAVEVHITPDAVVVHRHHAVPGEHRPPHRLDHHRTIAGLCAAGCDRVLAIGSTGSLRAWPVGTVAAPDDFYAPWVNPSFHDNASGHHIPGFAIAWRDAVLATWHDRTDTPIEDGGVYAQTQGPRFETPAEIRALSAHADLVGMTIAAECILAGEAGLAYAAVCVVDNLGNGLADEHLTFAGFEAGVERNRARLVRDLQAVVPALASVARPVDGAP